MRKHPSMSKQCGRWLGVLIGSAPLWVVGDFYFFVLRAYFHLGYWPKPHQPDPKDLPFPIHYNRLGIILFLGLLTLPLVYAFTLARLFWLKCQGAYIRWGGGYFLFERCACNRLLVCRSRGLSPVVFRLAEDYLRTSEAGIRRRGESGFELRRLHWLNTPAGKSDKRMLLPFGRRNFLLTH